MAYNPFGGFGPGMAGGASADPADWQRNFEALTRQYWTAWGESLRAASGQPAVPQGVPGWHDAVEWWSKLAHGGRSEANDLAERFNAQAKLWFGQMQQVAAQFAGQDHGAGDIARAWKQALGAAGDNPFPEIFKAMRGHGAQGLDQWIEDASPYLDAWRREGMSWLSLPAFGLGREHQERVQALARAQVEYQEQTAAYNALMAKSGERAFELFEAKLAEREEPGRQLTSARALFDLWIDAAEESYAQIALSPEFRSTYGALVNAQMRLRSGIQKEVELACGTFGMPTRSEMDAAHRKVADLERQLRRLRGAVPAAPAVKPAVGVTPRASGTQPAAKPVPKPAAKTTPAPKPAKKAASKSKAKPAAKAAQPAAKAARPAAKPVKRATRPARAVSRAARKASPASLLSGIAAPVAPSAKTKGVKSA
jgi:class III poly(R)-hydroxyalkanoic acid synthase PhaE subunit